MGVELVGYEHFTTVSATELWARIDLAQHRFVTLLQRVGADASVAGSDWSSGDVARHVLNVLHRYTRRDLRAPAGLAAAVADIATANDLDLRTLAGVPLEPVLGQIAEELVEIRRLLPGDDLHEALPFHAGTTVDVAGALANILGELVVHGLDVARGSDERWRIEVPDALLVINALVQLAPGFLRAPQPVALGFRTSGGRPWTLRIGPDATESHPTRTEEDLDAVVRGPAPTLLRSLYQRDSMLRSVFGGMLVVGGRRPWRVLQLPTVLPRV